MTNPDEKKKVYALPEVSAREALMKPVEEMSRKEAIATILKLWEMHKSRKDNH